MVDCPPWTETETAYIAGIVDGEGSIGVYKRTGHKSGFIHLSVTNTHKGLIEWLCVMFGLNPSQHARLNKANWKEWYLITMQGQRTYKILLRLKPFLRVKQEQAELAIRYWEWRKSIGFRNARHPLSESEKNHTMEIVELTHQLNKKGRGERKS